LTHTDVRLAVWNQRATSETIPVAWRWLASRIPLYIANSKAAAQTVREQLGVPQNRVVVVNNGTDTAVSSVNREELLAGFGIPANAFVVCMVANLTHFKDHRTLLEAWRRLQGHQLPTPAYLLLAGYAGDSADQVLSWIEQYGLTSSVRVIGFQSNIPALYAAVDIGVLSSLSEGLPNAVIECMVAGRPFVGTDIDGIREVVGEDYPYLAPPQDAIGLSNHLQQLMHSPKLCAELGIRNRLYAMDHFQMATQFLRYSDVLMSFMK
jgi:glycosyltransferase involved in cell wall biosynthesis